MEKTVDILEIEFVDRRSRQTIAWVTGGVYSTDNLDDFAKVLPKRHHIIGRSRTACIA